MKAPNSLKLLLLFLAIATVASSVTAQTNPFDSPPKGPPGFSAIPVVPANRLAPDVFHHLPESTSLSGIPEVGLRRRLIALNFSLLNSPRETIAFELFDDLTLRGQVKEFRAVLGTVMLLTGTFVAPQ